MFSSLSTAITIFSGFVSVTILRRSASCTGTVFTTTGMVTRKMISITSITSTSGVVLMVGVQFRFIVFDGMLDVDCHDATLRLRSVARAYLLLLIR